MTTTSGHDAERATAFARSKGLTPTERILAEIGERTFLSLWSYPNLFKTRNKELCDLLIVFGDTVVLFSDKSCAYPATQDDDLNWKRWYRKSIAKSAEQIRQAERWIRTYPHEIYLDSRCQRRLPVPIPDQHNLRIIRICVTLGHSYDLRPASDGANTIGSVGKVDERDGWIHVVSGDELPTLLRELSTTSDVIRYFEKKEESLLAGQIHYAASERDLLAYYILSARSLRASPCGICVPVGLWDSITSNPRHQERIAADAPSFFWDDQINQLTAAFQNNELEYASVTTVAEFERIARLMGREHRFARRCLCLWMRDRLQVVAASHHREDGPYTIGSLFPSEYGDLVYVLLVTPGSAREQHAEHREWRRKELILRCFAAKSRHPGTRIFLGIAMDASNGRGGSEDYFLLDTQDWGEQKLSKAQQISEDLEFFSNPTETPFSEDEYPP